MTGEHRKAIRTASQLVEDYAIRAPSDIDLEAIALDQGLFVTSGPLSGSWARLIRKGSTGIIRLSTSIRQDGQRRFCIAHEIGHFLLHGDRNQLALCSLDDMIPGYERGMEEPEANAFAGELLMPKALFRERLDPRELSLASLSNLSEAFTTTISATIHRVVDVSAHVCALVRSEGGTLKSYHRCADFPFRIRQMGSRLDARSCAGEFFRGLLEEKEADVPADAWLEEDHRLRGDETIRELTVPMPRYGAAVSILWIVPRSPLDYAASE